MKRLPLTDALLAHSVPCLDTKTSLVRVGLIQTTEALDIAEPMEKALNGRSAVLDAIARRRTEIRLADATSTAKDAKAREGGAA